MSIACGLGAWASAQDGTRAAPIQTEETKETHRTDLTAVPGRPVDYRARPITHSAAARSIASVV